MHRIIRTALASMGAAVVVAGGSLGVAYATAPTAPAQSSSSADADQVAALNKQADDVLAKIATLEKQLASTPAPTASPSQLTKEEMAVTTDQASYSSPQAPSATAQAPATAAAPATSANRESDEHDGKNGNDTDD